MIICQCNVITAEDVKGVVRSLLAKDPWIYVTIGMVYRELKTRGKCFGCLPVVIDHVIEAIEAERLAEQADPQWVDLSLVNLRLLRDRRRSVPARKRTRGPQHEREFASYRKT